MHGRSIRAQFHLIGPPAQGQTGSGLLRSEASPGLGTDKPQREVAPLPAARPDDQPPGHPIRAMDRPPGVSQSGTQLSPRLAGLPERLQIQGRPIPPRLPLCLHRFPPAYVTETFQSGHDPPAAGPLFPG